MPRSLPAARLVTCYEFGYGWSVGQQSHAGCRGHCDRAQLPRLDVFNRVGQRIEGDLKSTGNQIGQRLRPAAIRHVNQVNPGHHLEQFSVQMRARPASRRAHIDLSRIGFGVRDEFGHGLWRERRIHHHGSWPAAVEGRDRRDVGDEIKAELFIKGRVDRIGRLSWRRV